jgi:hypothetical protein
MEVDPKELKMGIEVEKEHSKVLKGDKKKIRQVALDHLKELPDYYTRLKKMEKEGGVKEAWVDPIEVLHKATMARIRKGAKQGKYWLLRSEGVEEAWGPGPRNRMRHKDIRGRKYQRASYTNTPMTGRPTATSGGGVSGALGTGAMNEETRKELIRRILETTTTANIGGYNKPFAGGGDFKQKSDPAFGGRNKVAPAMLRNAVDSLCKGKSKRHPAV